jgi:uncharacterized protein (TIGR02246 family)
VPSSEQADRAEIAQLIARYFRTVDVGDRAMVASMFTEDGEFHGIDGTFVGRTQVAEFFGAAGTDRDRRRHGGGLHIVSPPCITVDGDSATSWSSVLYVVAGRDGAPQVVFAGEYNDDFRKVDGEWLIAVRRATDHALAQ